MVPVVDQPIEIPTKVMTGVLEPLILEVTVVDLIVDVVHIVQ